MVKNLNQEIINKYNNGQSMNSIAKELKTYPTTIKRILDKNNVELRHDEKKEGSLYVKDGEKLIEWAKAQGRLVTKAELAKVIGTKRLSPSYFEKYPELGQYVVIKEQNELYDYSQKLYTWLRKNNIKYKPNDRTKLKKSVTALLLGEYKNIIIQLNIKPTCVSRSKFEKGMEERLYRADQKHMHIVWLHERHFDDLDSIKKTLDLFKNKN